MADGGGGGGGDGGGGGGGDKPSLFGEQEIWNAIQGLTDDNPFQSPAVIAADWLGFIILGGSSVVLCYMLMGFKGPRGNQPYHMGYREPKMFCVYVNSFAAYVYWARVCSHANGDVGPIAYIHLLKYVDYLFTCPLLTADLLCSLNLPYKVTYSYWVWLTIGTGVGCTKFVGAGRYMWFCFGMFIFGVAYWNIYVVVMMRIRQLQGSKLTSSAASVLNVAVVTYFSIWHGFWILWLLLEFKVISHPISLCMHTVLDVLAKSFYGFVLLKFQLMCDTEDFVFLPLDPGNPQDEVESVGDDVHTVGPVVGSAKQRMSVSKQYGGHVGPMYSSRVASDGQYSDRDVESLRPPLPAMPLDIIQQHRRASGGTPPAQNDQTTFDIMRQIQALNEQLDHLPNAGGLEGSPAWKGNWFKHKQQH